MSAIPYPLELQLRCCNSNAGALPAHAIRMCREGFRLHMDRAARRCRCAPAVALGPFVVLAVLTLLFGFQFHAIPALECFIGMIGWIVIFYGLSGQMQWERIRSASVHQAGRMNAWLAMLSLFMLSVRRVVEQHIQARISMLGVILSRLQACLRHGLGLIDPNLTTFRLVPPESAHALALRGFPRLLLRSRRVFHLLTYGLRGRHDTFFDGSSHPGSLYWRFYGRRMHCRGTGGMTALPLALLPDAQFK
jgi:hypothetical protein